MRLAASIYAAFLLFFVIAPAQAEKRVALVIGNDRYTELPQLHNAVADARAVAQALRDLQFRVFEAENLDYRAANRLHADFEAAIAPGDTAFVFFSGHGVAIGAENYLLPTDTEKPKSGEENLVRSEAHSVDTLIRRVQSKGATASFFVIDACRDNPFETVGVKSVGSSKGLGRVDPPSGVFVLFAAGIGQTALDRLSTADRSPNSVFTRSLLPLLRQPGLTHLAIAKRVQTEVKALAATVGHLQQPAFYDQIDGELIFKPVQPGADAKPPQVTVLAPQSPADPCGIGAISVSFASRPAVPLCANEERSLKPKDAFKECDKCPEMIMVPAGRFTMGSPVNEPGREDNEGPQHQVTIGKAFAVGKFAVTFEEWESCVADGGCNRYEPNDQGWGRGRQPVINVSWSDANAYALWVSRKTGKLYRLLTEAEREYVTRAGTATPFWSGSSITSKLANYDKNDEVTIGKRTVPVDSFEPNAWGVYQVHGNVWEWVEDCWHDNYQGAPADASAWTTRDCSSRVLRGGSWDYVQRFLRSADRNRLNSDLRVSNVGFRLARAVN
jgi:formylglycine-generating enzyme required for sulfatase activity